jgi:hypothetical protein
MFTRRRLDDMKTVRWMAAAALVAALPLFAEAVTVTAHGKSYHKTASCGVLSRSKVTYQVDRAAAESHGLRPCGNCYRVAVAPKSPNAAPVPAWMKGGK